MSYLFDSAPQGITGYHFGCSGLGQTGAYIRANTATGDHGPGYLYNDWDSSADDAKEFQGLVLTPPVAGTLFAYEDGSFTFSGAPDGTYTFTYRLYVDGVDLGTQTATIVIGGGGVLGASSITLGTISGSAAGAVLIQGAGAATLASIVTAAAGQVLVQGGGSVTLGAVVSLADGQVTDGTPVIGSGSVTLGVIVSAASGTVGAPAGTRASASSRNSPQLSGSRRPSQLGATRRPRQLS